MMFIALLFAFATLCCARPSDDLAWEEYKVEFEKHYESEDEEVARYEQWKNNMVDMAVHNAQYEKTYSIGINQFSDMSQDEFESKMLGGLKIPQYVLEDSDPNAKLFVPTNAQLPASVDWRTKGYVTDVKNQGQCGSCYSFAATGSLEGAWFAKKGELPSLSESQIVDCSRRYGNQGCQGGWYQQAWAYIKDCGGSDSEDSYPYQAQVGWCRFNRRTVAAMVTGYTNTQSGSEAALQEAVATKGPVAVAISVSGQFGRYSHGVYYNPGCRNDLWHLNHAVLVVGYGSESGQDYWLVKNSWGTRYGLSGYIKMARNRGNNCGIATKPSYPEV